jgi:single-strand DNA-binding protein
MASFHQITLIGYAGGDVDLRHTGEGDPVAGFSVGVTDKSKSGEEHTEWYRCSVWGKSADVAKEYIRKGGQVMVIGRPRVETFKRRDLTVGAVSHITVDRFVLLGSANGDGKQDSASAASSSISADSPASSQFTDEEMPL